jgi:dTDP-4-amino-4,6-dideoxygalactose transaminase
MPILALRGGLPVRTAPFPRWPVWDDAERQAVLDVLESGNWGGFPFPNTKGREFGARFAAAQGAAFGLPVTNGTVAIELALKAAGVGAGDEVIVPAYTWDSTAGAILFAGGVPVFVDVDADRYCLDPAQLEAALSSRTRAIVPVHLGMNMVDMDAILEVAKRHSLAVVEDCAHAQGAQWRGRGAGSLGDAGTFSFQSSKLMSAGEGGAVITNSPAIRERVAVLVNCGRSAEDGVGNFRAVGHNYRMTEFQAAILLAQLDRLEAQTTLREDRALHLEKCLADLAGIRTLPRDPRQTRRALYHFVLRYDADHFGGVPRDAFVAALAAEGIPVEGVFYEAVYRSPLFPAAPGSFRALPCPVSERAAYEESVWIPHWVLAGSVSDVEDVASAVRKVCEHALELRGFDHPSIREKGLSRADRVKV